MKIRTPGTDRVYDTETGEYTFIGYYRPLTRAPSWIEKLTQLLNDAEEHDGTPPETDR
jgi:hypothetical protein